MSIRIETLRKANWRLLVAMKHMQVISLNINNKRLIQVNMFKAFRICNQALAPRQTSAKWATATTTTTTQTKRPRSASTWAAPSWPWETWTWPPATSASTSKRPRSRRRWTAATSIRRRHWPRTWLLASLRVVIQGIRGTTRRWSIRWVGSDSIIRGKTPRMALEVVLNWSLTANRANSRPFHPRTRRSTSLASLAASLTRQSPDDPSAAHSHSWKAYDTRKRVANSKWCNSQVFLTATSAALTRDRWACRRKQFSRRDSKTFCIMRLQSWTGLLSRRWARAPSSEMVREMPAAIRNSHQNNKQKLAAIPSEIRQPTINIISELMMLMSTNFWYLIHRCLTIINFCSIR